MTAADPPPHAGGYGSKTCRLLIIAYCTDKPRPKHRVAVATSRRGRFQFINHPSQLNFAMAKKLMAKKAGRMLAAIQEQLAGNLAWNFPGPTFARTRAFAVSMGAMGDDHPPC